MSIGTAPHRDLNQDTIMEEVNENEVKFEPITLGVHVGAGLLTTHSLTWHFTIHLVHDKN